MRRRDSQPLLKLTESLDRIDRARPVAVHCKSAYHSAIAHQSPEARWLRRGDERNWRLRHAEGVRFACYILTALAEFVREVLRQRAPVSPTRGRTESVLVGRQPRHYMLVREAFRNCAT